MHRILAGLVRCLLLGLVLFGQVQGGEEPKPLSAGEAQNLARQYLAETDAAKKQALLEKCGTTPAESADAFVRLILPAGYPPAKTGLQHGLKLDVPATVSDKPVEYSISVPGKYAPNRLWPLFFGLHGGGNNTGSGQQHIGAMVGMNRLDAIVVCPTSVDLGVQKYWRNPKNEEALKLLIRHLSRQFAIDPDRIYLTGYSMGGIGSYYLGARMTDVFAATAPGGGAWHGIHWPVMLNTPVYIWHGKKDMRGKNFTDFPNAENAAAILKELGYDHHFAALDCGHAPTPASAETAMGEWLLTKKRDPYAKRIVTSSPRAKDFSGMLLPAPPDRWLAIDEIGPAKLEMEGVAQGGTPRMKHKVAMGTLDAKWSGPNQLEVAAENVKRFRVFLSPKLVNLKQPLKITVNGKVAHDGPAPTSLKFLLQYLDERRDPSMVFLGEVSVSVP
ncbi:MAG: hypothetical protein AMXMBFR7_14960 [Planctomycetota bacterium]